MTTAKKATTTTDPSTAPTVPTFTILDEEPEFQRARGRAKSPLRVAMEELPVGKSMVGAEESTPQLLNSIRQKAQEIRSIAKKDGVDVRFGVRVDVQNRIIVTRKS